MKKSQIDTFGLVMIVILLVFIAIFALPFIIKEKSVSLDEDYMQLVANNLRSVVLNTNVCDLATVKDEISNCLINSPACLNDCGELNDIIKNIIENSLGSLKGKVNYKFSFGDLEVKNRDCVEKITSSKFFIDEIEIRLELCSRR